MAISPETVAKVREAMTIDYQPVASIVARSQLNDSTVRTALFVLLGQEKVKRIRKNRRTTFNNSSAQPYFAWALK